MTKRCKNCYHYAKPNMCFYGQEISPVNGSVIQYRNTGMYMKPINGVETFIFRGNAKKDDKLEMCGPDARFFKEKEKPTLWGILTTFLHNDLFNMHYLWRLLPQDLNTCTECVYHKREGYNYQKNKGEERNWCRRYGINDIVGEDFYIPARCKKERSDESLCGASGKYFIKKSFFYRFKKYPTYKKVEQNEQE